MKEYKVLEFFNSEHANKMLASYTKMCWTVNAFGAREYGYWALLERDCPKKSSETEENR